MRQISFQCLLICEFFIPYDIKSKHNPENIDCKKFTRPVDIGNNAINYLEELLLNQYGKCEEDVIFQPITFLHIHLIF